MLISKLLMSLKLFVLLFDTFKRRKFFERYPKKIE